MSQKTPSILNRISWKVEHYGYVFLERLLGSFSIESIYTLGEFIGALFYRFSPSYRAIVKRNLRVVMSNDSNLANPTDEEIEAVFRRNGGNFLSTLIAHNIKADNLSKYLEIEGLDKLSKALESTGAVLMLAHMGNWELLTKFTTKLPKSVPMGAIYRPLNNPHVNDLVLKRRESAGMTLVSYNNPAFTLLRLLKKRGIVSILSDQRIGNRGEHVAFFGCPTQCSRLPHLLHEKTSAPLFTIAMSTVGPAKWRLTFSHQENLTQQEAFDQLAIGMQTSPSDCFWFQDRWQEFPNLKWLKEAQKCHSQIFQAKRLVCILESRALLEQYPMIEVRLKNYDLKFWSEGDCPSDAYIAIYDKDLTFVNQCKKYGLKKGCRPIKVAIKALKL